MSAIELFASQKRVGSVLSSCNTSTSYLEMKLQEMRSYNIASWAECLRISNPTVSYNDLFTLGTIWKHAGEIFACQILRNLTSNHTLQPDPPTAGLLIRAYAPLERHDDEIVRCLIWPTFVAGAVSHSQEERAWVLKKLDRIWDLGRCANTRNAGEVLQCLWQRHDQQYSSCSSHQSSPAETSCLVSSEQYSPDQREFHWDWVTELSQLEGCWLFV